LRCYQRHRHYRYRCGHCGAKLQQKGRCPYCGSLNT
jgi:DNA-directed RNA polymerase subunit RPC12/RpoP